MSSTAVWKRKHAMHFVCIVCGWLLLFASIAAAQDSQGSNKANLPDQGSVSQSTPNSAVVNQSEINELKGQLAKQQKQIEELQVTLQNQAKQGEDSSAKAAAETRSTVATGSGIRGEVASMVPMLPSAPLSVNQATAAPKPAAAAEALPAYLKAFHPIGTFYLSYSAQTTDSGIDKTTGSNSFQLKRGYFGADVDLRHP